MANLADTRTKLKDLRELMVKARDDLHAVGLDVSSDLEPEVKAMLQGLIKNASAGIHTVVLAVAELEEGIAAL